MADGYRDEFEALLAKKKALEAELRSANADLQSFRDREQPPAQAEPQPAAVEPPAPEPERPASTEAEALLLRLLDLCETTAEKAALRHACSVLRGENDEQALAELLSGCRDSESVIREARFANFKKRYRQITGEDYREPENLRGEVYIPGFGGDDLISVNPFDDWLYWVNLRFKTFVRKRTDNRLLRGLLFCLIYGVPL